MKNLHSIYTDSICKEQGGVIFLVLSGLSYEGALVSISSIKPQIILLGIWLMEQGKISLLQHAL